MTSSRETLLRAADLIDRHGWVQGEFRTFEGCLCADGAIIVATGEAGSLYDLSVERRSARNEARAALMQHLGFEVTSQIYDWNDEHGRTVTEVTAALRAAARGADRD